MKLINIGCLIVTLFAIPYVLVGASVANQLVLELRAEDLSLNDGDPIVNWQNKAPQGEQGYFYPLKEGSTTFRIDPEGVKSLVFSGSQNSVMKSDFNVPGSILGRNSWSTETWVKLPSGIVGVGGAYFAWTKRAGLRNNNYTVMELFYYPGNPQPVEHWGKEIPDWGYFKPPVGRWHLISVTYDGSVERVYLDGVLHSSRENKSINLRSDKWFYTIGSAYNDRGNYWDHIFKGEIGTIRVHTGVLSPEAVRANFQEEAGKYGLSFLTSAEGKWGEATSWAGGQVPPSGSIPYIFNGGRVTLTNRVEISSLIGENGGVKIDGGTLTVRDSPIPALYLGRTGNFSLDIASGSFILQDEKLPLKGGNRGSVNAQGSLTATVGGNGEKALLSADAQIVVSESSAEGSLTVGSGGMVVSENNNIFASSLVGKGNILVDGGCLSNNSQTASIILSDAGSQGTLTLRNGGRVHAGKNLAVIQTGRGRKPVASLLAESGAVISVGGCLLSESDQNAVQSVVFDGARLIYRNSTEKGMDGIPGVTVRSGGITVEVPAGKEVRISTPFNGEGAGAKLVKRGRGRLILTGISTLAGGIDLQEGTLIVNDASWLQDKPLNVEPGTAIGYGVPGGVGRLLSAIPADRAVTLVLQAPNAGDDLDLTGRPDTSWIADSPFEYTGTYTPFSEVERIQVVDGLSYFTATCSGVRRMEISGTKAATLALPGQNSHTGGTLVRGCRVRMDHPGALGVPATEGTRDIKLEEGAVLLFNFEGDPSDIIGRLTLDSAGCVALCKPMQKELDYDLSLLPGVSFSMAGGGTYTGSLTPHASGFYIDAVEDDSIAAFGALAGDYPLSIRGRGELNEKGEKINSGYIRLNAGNTYSGGTRISRGGILYIGSSSDSLGLLPPVEDPDNLTFDWALLRVDKGTQPTLPAVRGIKVGEGGLALSPYGGNPRSSLTIAGNLSGSGPISVVDAGILAFEGTDNRYTGTLSLDSGCDLRIGSGSSFSWQGARIDLNRGKLELNTDTDRAMPTVIEGVASLVKTGSGALSIPRVSVKTISIGAGALRLADLGDTGTIEILPSTSLILSGSGSFGASLTGGGLLVKEGKGILSWTGNAGEFQGQVSLNGGTFVLGRAGNPLPKIQGLTVNTGAMFSMPGEGNFSLGRISARSGGIIRLSTSSVFRPEELTLEGGSELRFGIGRDRCALLNPGNLVLPSLGKVILSMEVGETSLPIKGSRYTLIMDDTLTGEDLGKFDLRFSQPDLAGSLTLSGNMLSLQITESPELGNPLLTWEGNGQPKPVWDLVTPLWKEGEAGNPIPFRTDHPALIRDLGGASEIVVAAGIHPGELHFENSAPLTLSGEKLQGRSRIIKGGTGTLTLEGKGFDSQPVIVTGGTLKLGTDISSNVLGNASVPLLIKEGGTLDVNYTAETSDDGDRNSHTSCKVVSVEGTGADGSGAIVNTGRASDATFSSVTLTGDTTLGVGKRMGIAGRTSEGQETRGLLKGADLCLTLLGSSGDSPLPAGESGLTVRESDVKLGSIRVEDGALLRFASGVTLDLSGNISLGAGAGLFLGTLPDPLLAPVDLVGGRAVIAAEGTSATIASPVRIAPEAVLELRGNSQESTILYQGKIEGEGTIRAHSGHHQFEADVAPRSVEMESAVLSFLDSENPRLFPESFHARSTENRVRIFPRATTRYTGMTLDYSGDTFGGYFYPSLTEGNNVTSIYENTLISGWDINLSIEHMQSHVLFGTGVSADLNRLYLGSSIYSPQSSLTLAEGARVSLTNEFRIGMAKNNGPHDLILAGGELSSAQPINIGQLTRYSRLDIRSGTVTAPAVYLRTSDSSRDWDGEEFLNLEGGVLRLGKKGLDSHRAYTTWGQVFFGGGRLESTESWTATKGVNIHFDRFRQDPDPSTPFVLDTAGHTVTLDGPLQGGAPVHLVGEGTVQADTALQGGLTGHWTVECGVEGGAASAILGNAASFADGLSIVGRRTVEVDIDSPSRYVSLGYAHCHPSRQGDGDRFRDSNDLPYPWFSSQMRDNRLLEQKETGRRFNVYAFKGSFRFHKGGSYHIGCNYYGWESFYLDGAFKVLSSRGNSKSFYQAYENSVWHDFRVAAVSRDGKGGHTQGRYPSSVYWTADGNWQPFDTDILEMRPATTVRHARIANAADIAPGKWKEAQGYRSIAYANSLRELFSAAHANEINDYSGWIRVEAGQAGEWSFTGAFEGGSLSLWIDNVERFNVGDGEGLSERVVLEEGFHRFRLRSWDRGGGKVPSLNYAVNGVSSPFDEGSLLISATPYGMIGGRLSLDAGSVLHNHAPTPCEVTGTLSGSGTLAGPFALRGATWEIALDPRQKTAEPVKFLHSVPSPAAGIGKLRVVFSGKPLLAHYDLGPAYGITGTPEDLKDLLEVTVSGIPVNPDDFVLSVDGQGDHLILQNNNSLGTLLFLR